MKDTLVSLMKIVEPNSGATEEAKTAVEEKYCKHMMQLMCCRAMDAILKVPEAGSTADVKVCLARVEEALGRMALSLEAHAGTAWAPMAESWASKNIVRQCLAVCVRR
jgi:site-specific recombinase